MSFAHQGCMVSWGLVQKKSANDTNDIYKQGDLAVSRELA